MSRTEEEPIKGDIIAVDLDGTLLRTDILFESIAALLRRPWVLFAVGLRLAGGRAAMKAELAKRVHLDVTRLPANAPFVDWLQGERGQGRKLALYSASNDTVVRRVAARFGFFEHAEGSGERINLAGTKKYEAIERRYGPAFAYAGDSHRDVPIWERCGHAVLVGDVERLRRRLPDTIRVERVFPCTGGGPRVWARALRLHQWIKNALIFVPLFLSGNLQGHLALATLLGFVAFGFIASASYLLNDLMDLLIWWRIRMLPMQSGADSLLRAGNIFALLAERKADRSGPASDRLVLTKQCTN